MRYSSRTAQSSSISGWGKPAAGGGTIRKVATFTSSGTWTVPLGITYAIANMVGGGGGCNVQDGGPYGVSGTPGTSGGTSSVAFTSGTVTALGGSGVNCPNGISGRAGATNSGEGGGSGGLDRTAIRAGDGAFVRAGAVVTPGENITVTVGANGSGTYNGGSGIVWIEYEVLV